MQLISGLNYSKIDITLLLVSAFSIFTLFLFGPLSPFETIIPGQSTSPLLFLLIGPAVLLTLVRGLYLVIRFQIIGGGVLVALAVVALLLLFTNDGRFIRSLPWAYYSVITFEDCAQPNCPTKARIVRATMDKLADPADCRRAVMRDHSRQFIQQNLNDWYKSGCGDLKCDRDFRPIIKNRLQILPSYALIYMCE